MSIFQRCNEVIFISNSSGFNLLTQWLEQIELPDTKITIVALGPVSWKSIFNNQTSYDVTIIKGKKDYYSQLLDRHIADRWVDSTHFDYDSNSEVKDLIIERLKKKTNQN